MKTVFRRVATMPEHERNALIASIIAKIIKEESEGKTSDIFRQV